MGKLVSFILKMMISGGKKVAKELDEVTRDPKAQQEKVLSSILAKNADTEFGKEYGFARIKTTEDYQKAVPLTGYSLLSPFIERMMKGEKNVLTADEVVHYNVTSGTMGVPKNIPVTEEQVSLFAKINSKYLYYVVAKELGTDWTKGMGLSLSEGTYDLLPTGVSIGSASSLHTARMAKAMPFMKGSPMDMMYTSPKEARQPTALGVYTRYLHAVFALREKNITYGNVTFSSVLLEMMRYIELHWEVMCDDIENGTLNGITNMPDAERVSAMKKMKPMPKRAEELREIFKNHLSEPFGALIWPNLQFFMCVGGAGFQTYTDKLLARYLGKDTRILYLGLSSSEGLYSVPTGMDSAESVLVPNGMYMEFIPVKDGERDTTQNVKRLWELEKGKQYELLITNLSGLYRYQLKDVVEVTGFYHKTPTIRFVNRSGFAINMVAEKTSYVALENTAIATCREMGLELYDYCVCPLQDEKGSRYIFLYELNAESKQPDRDVLRDKTEQHLRDANFYYDMALKVGHLQPTEVRLLQEETFMLYHDLMVMKGCALAQLKPVHVTSNPYQEKLFLTMVKE